MQLKFFSLFLQNDRFYCILSAMIFGFQLTQILKGDWLSRNFSIIVIAFSLLMVLWDFFCILKPDGLKNFWFLISFLSTTITFHIYLSLYLINDHTLYFEVLAIIGQAENLIKRSKQSVISKQSIIFERFAVFIIFSIKFNFFVDRKIESLFYLGLLLLLIFKIVFHQNRILKEVAKPTKNMNNQETMKPIKNNESDNIESHFQILNHFREAIILFDSNHKIKWHNDFLYRIFDVPKSSSIEQIQSIILNIEQEENSMNAKSINMTNHQKMTQAFKAFHSRVESIVECGIDSENDMKSPGLSTLGRNSEVISRNVSRSTAAMTTDFGSSSKYFEFCSKKNFKGKKSYFLNQNGNFASEHNLISTQKKRLKNFLIEIFSSLNASVLCIVEDEPDFQKFNMYGSLLIDKDSPKQTYFISFYPYKGDIFVCLRLLDQNDLILSLYNNNISQNKQLASMCHELRTPLNSVTNMLEILQSEIQLTNREESQHKEYIANALWNSKLLLSSINDFLDFFSISSQIFSLDLLKFNIQNFSQEIIDLFRPHAEKKGLKFLFNNRVNSQKPFNTDPKRLRQIILNILSNSIRFTQEGFVSITMKEKMNFLKFSIKDSGLGIAKNELLHLANFQGIQHNRSQTTGGFGLCISNYLANYLGPTLNETIRDNWLFRGLKVKTGVGKGTKFSFIIRNNDKVSKNLIKESLASIQEDLSQSIASENRQEMIEKILANSLTEYKFIEIKSETKNETLAPQSGVDTPINEFDDDHEFKIKSQKIEEKKCKCPKVLAVDDNEFNLFVLRERFLKKNITIDIAHSGVEAIRNISEFIEKKNSSYNFCEKCQFYRLILMDIDMPIKNGFETTKELKELFKEAKINVPIVALSAFNQNDMQEKVTESGIDQYYEKPFTQEYLDKIVHDYI